MNSLIWASCKTRRATDGHAGDINPMKRRKRGWGSELHAQIGANLRQQDYVVS